MGKESIRKGDPCLLNLLPGLQPVPHSACQQEKVKPERGGPHLQKWNSKCTPRQVAALNRTQTTSRTELAFDLHVQCI